MHNWLRLIQEQRAKRTDFQPTAELLCIRSIWCLHPSLSSPTARSHHRNPTTPPKKKKEHFYLYNFSLSGQPIPFHSQCGCLEYSGNQTKIDTHINSLDFLALNARSCLEVPRLVQDLRRPYLQFPNFRSSLWTKQAARGEVDCLWPCPRWAGFPSDPKLFHISKVVQSSPRKTLKANFLLSASWMKMFYTTIHKNSPHCF